MVQPQRNFYVGPADGFYEIEFFKGQMSDLEMKLVVDAVEKNKQTEPETTEEVMIFIGHGATVHYSFFWMKRGGIPRVHVKLYGPKTNVESLTSRMKDAENNVYSKKPILELYSPPRNDSASYSRVRRSLTTKVIRGTTLHSIIPWELPE